MSVLLMQLAGMQSWGETSRYPYVRDTASLPTKSGVVGMICCAQGRPRGSDLSDLAALLMGVRADVVGDVIRDYHTVTRALRSSGGVKPQSVSERFYLSPDSRFLVGLQGDPRLLRQIHRALRNPRWLLFLGRRSCPPAAPVYLEDGLRQGSLAEVLSGYPWLGRGSRPAEVLLEIEDVEGPIVRPDHPQGGRAFGPRYTTRAMIPLPPLPPEQEAVGTDKEED